MARLYAGVVLLFAAACSGSTHDVVDGGVDSGSAIDATIDDAGANDFGVDAGAPDASGPLDYTGDTMWLCRPGMVDDACLTADLTATEIHPDGTRTVVTSTALADPPYDCFYVYPTVDVTSPAGNHTDFTDTSFMLDPLLSQVARFREQCRIFAPLYRQSTLAGLSGAGAPARLELAYRDVEAAFREYLAHDAGTSRHFVIMGHSQGSYMSERLLTDVIAPDPTLRSRLIVALLIGGAVQVPTGATTGGTLGSFPLCTSDTETGCAVHYHTFGEHHAPASGNLYSGGLLPGDEAACVDPASLSSPGTEAPLRAAYFPLSSHGPAFNIPFSITPAVATPFLLYRDYYAAACTSNTLLASYLEIRARPMSGDTRGDPVPYGNFLLSPSFIGLHILDFTFALGDLQALVATKAAAL